MFFVVNDVENPELTIPHLRWCFNVFLVITLCDFRLILWWQVTFACS